ncbi:MAG: tRNA pseudouridine(38-40) synthase TruA [Alphaproteobacteria bacterium]|nr:tRNA pseudouridine(38-40) synthase TruA [Alphaproteobacteria bacterium]MBP7759505.1 tRNA pseudouridine(38-40) synthase TruA [Alphaproteobacteria bacterium]MBP7762923.1 tRNA pseudouridine(38-40) synthase TruA [Alphaproteobacteria bacterium]MBP7905199.1 tRNA pseudouridine(38-40) synthase TruA [Alphaproteobacteria bacterium]
MPTRWKFTIEYDGGGFSGWQRQEEGIPTVQNAIEQAIKAFSGQTVTLHVAGRTDAGVHARGQVAHVDLEEFSKPMEPFEVAKAINALLRPQAVSILQAEPVAPDFEARYHAKSKTYRYRIINRYPPLALDRDLAWNIKKPLDVAAMREGAKLLIGHHDFSSFRDAECQAASPQKTLDKIEITDREYDFCGGREIFFELQARSFLHHMVRNIAGTLSLVGEGKWKPLDVKKALDARDRTKGGPTAPSCGLYLMRVEY